MFGAVFATETNDEYRTITPEMLNEEQSPPQNQLYQPNVENAASSFNSYSFRKDNFDNQSPQGTSTVNYGYSVRSEPHNRNTKQPMNYNFDPENISKCDFFRAKSYKIRRI